MGLHTRRVEAAELRAVEPAAAHVGDPWGTLAVRTRNLDLVGETALRWVAVRPRNNEARDGYLSIHDAWITGIVGDRAYLFIGLPKGVSLLASRAPIPCAELTLYERDIVAPPVGPPEVDLADGLRTPLSLEPGGTAFAMLRTPPKPAPRDEEAPREEAPRPGVGVSGFTLSEQTLLVHLLARRGNHVQLRLSNGLTTVVGWTTGSALKARKKKVEPRASSSGRLPVPSPVAPPRGATTLRCSGPITLYLRSGERLAAIGKIRPGAAIVLPDGVSPASGELAVAFTDGDVDIPEMRAGATEKVRASWPFAFVGASAVQGCERQGGPTR